MIYSLRPPWGGIDMSQKINISISFNNEPSKEGIENYTRILNDLFTKSMELDIKNKDAE
ncbi:MAG: hypothetical protein ACJAX4_002275 [Clostridium sp.]